MELILKNPIKTDKSTISELWNGYDLVCHTLEDEDKLSKGKPKEFGTTAIPAGRYMIKITRSVRFSKMLGHDVVLPELLSVPEFEGVRIHSLNKPEETEGCIGVGSYDSSKPDWISHSTDAMIKVMALLTTSKEDNYITIDRNLNNEIA